MRRSILALALCVLSAAPLTAQRKGSWELGAFARYNWWDDSFNVNDSTSNKNSFGGGARIGWAFAERWGLELDGSANVTDFDVPNGARSVGLIWVPFHLRLMFEAPLGSRLSWLLGVGPGYNRYYTSAAAPDFLEKRFEGDDWGVGALTGFRFKFADWISLRVDGTLDYVPSPTNEAEDNKNWGVQAGLSLHFGGRCRDKLDSISVAPKTASVRTGEQVTFRVTGIMCDGATTDAAAGTTATVAGGPATMTGLTFSSETPGTYQVRFENLAARKRKTDNATVTVTAPPDTTPRLVRIDLTPDSATIFVGERVQLTVTGHYSNNTTRVLTDCQLTPDGGTVSEGRFSADREGRYTVTANCPGGLSDRSVFTVRPFPTITLRALFRFDSTNVGDSLRAELDTLRWLARTMAERPGLQLTIYGHADFIGTDEYNCNLGWWRIEAVVDTLRSFGAASAVLDAMRRQSFGERQPSNPGRTDRARAENRRVEIFDTPTAERERRYDPSKACGPKTKDRERRP